jgi:hypothetical protein
MNPGFLLYILFLMPLEAQLKNCTNVMLILCGEN